MSERVGVYLLTETGLKSGSLNSFGDLRVGRGNYLGHHDIAESFVDDAGKRVFIDDILVPYEAFNEFACDLRKNRVKISQSQNPADL